MAYYFWNGVDIEGNLCSGKQSAVSLEYLDNALFSRGIALLSYERIQAPWFSRSVAPQDVSDFFGNLATLLKAGVRLEDALLLVSNHISRIAFHDVVHGIYIQLTKGIFLYKALAHYPAVFDELSVAMIQVGYESGNLAASLEKLQSYYIAREKFKRQMRMLLMVPSFTLLVMIGIFSGMIGYVLPYFQQLLENFKTPISPSMSMMFHVGDWVRVSWGITCLALCMVIIIGSLVWRSNSQCRAYGDYMVVRFPFWGELARLRVCNTMMRGLAILLRAKVNLITACRIVMPLCTNMAIRNAWSLVIQDLQRGYSLSQACALHMRGYLQQEELAVIIVGENSSRLDILVEQLACYYHDELSHRLERILSLVQPIVMIGLGILMLLIMGSLYMPLMSVSYTIM